MPGPGTLLDLLTRWLKGLGGACLLGMALVTGADIIGRAMGHPIFGSEEIVSILATLTMACSLPYAHSVRSHISVEIFVRNMKRRSRAILHLVIDTTCMALFGLVTWRMFLYGSTMQRSGRVSMNLELPEHMVVWALGAGFAVFTLCIARDVLQIFRGGRQ